MVQIDKTRVGALVVSTVYAIDTKVYETMVFLRESHRSFPQYTREYTTARNALIGHDETVAEVQKIGATDDTQE